MTRQISEERKFAYYFGMVLIVIGVLMFFSVFLTGAMNFGDFSNFESNARSSMFRGFGGMFFIILGAVIRSIGERGIAGSGVVLDPEQARQELEPFSRMAGGMVKDALDEADISIGGQSRKVVMIKCSTCGKLNEEDSKFCQECGNQF